MSRQNRRQLAEKVQDYRRFWVDIVNYITPRNNLGFTSFVDGQVFGKHGYSSHFLIYVGIT